MRFLELLIGMEFVLTTQLGLFRANANGIGFCHLGVGVSAVKASGEPVAVCVRIR